MQELVSVVLPVRNHYRFIKERVATILNQSFTNWQCIVIDGYSTDGTWEWLQENLSANSKFKLIQRDPKGIYDAWNYGISLTEGEYVYIATSDDTMRVDCLEIFHSKLSNHPECSLAHCLLECIDEQSRTILPNPWLKYLPQLYYQENLFSEGVRKAPVDGILHAYLFSVYTSVTQLFFRRRVFDEIGFFSTEFGPKSDFEWCMRASLIKNVLHIPEYLATWRIHDSQATSFNKFDFYHDYLFMAKMVTSASKKVEDMLSSGEYKKIKRLHLFYSSRFVQAGYVKQSTTIQKFKYLFFSFLRYPMSTYYYIKTRNQDPIPIAKNALRILGR